MVRIAQTAVSPWIYARINPKGGAYEKPPLPRSTLCYLQQACRFKSRLSADETAKPFTQSATLKESRPHRAAHLSLRWRIKP